MTWNEHFVTGIAVIDEQHHWLIDLVNASAPVLALNYQHNHLRAESLLDQLVNYASFHFATEDRLMREHGVDLRHHEDHVESHGRFASEVARMRAAYTGGDVPSGSNLLTFLAHWLVFHILGEDQALARQVHAIGTGLSPEEAFEKAEGGRLDPTHEALTRALIDLYTLMTEQIGKLMESNHELEIHRHRLEELVGDRTADLMKALDAAQAANHARNSFIANMSHEIRTPMNAVVGLTWSLKQNASDPAQLAHLKQIGDATQQLLDIINDLLDMARLESEHLALEPLDFDPGKVLQEVCSGIEATAQAKALTLALHAPGLPRLVHGDPLRLGQILANFASNAVKFTEHGQIGIRASHQPDGNGRIRLRFEVADTGPGVPREQLPRLFEPFAQVDTSPTRRHGGTGLGLAISRRLAELMGGAVGVESTPGRGSTFWLELPMQIVAAALAGNEGGAPAAGSGVERAAQHPQLAMHHRETLHRLAELLADDDVQALSLWQKSAAGLRAAFNGRPAPFETALAAYDFAAAHALLRQTLAELDEQD